MNLNDYYQGVNSGQQMRQQKLNFEKFMSNANLVILNDEHSGPESLPTIQVSNSIVQNNRNINRSLYNNSNLQNKLNDAYIENLYNEILGSYSIIQNSN